MLSACYCWRENKFKKEAHSALAQITWLSLQSIRRKLAFMSNDNVNVQQIHPSSVKVIWQSVVQVHDESSSVDNEDYGPSHRWWGVSGISLYSRQHAVTDFNSKANWSLFMHLQVVILDNDRSGILERMQDGVHSGTTGASARSWWTPTPASWYSFCGPPECNGGPAGGISCWKILCIYNRVALATLVCQFQPSPAWLFR